MDPEMAIKWWYSRIHSVSRYSWLVMWEIHFMLWGNAISLPLTTLDHDCGQLQYLWAKYINFDVIILPHRYKKGGTDIWQSLCPPVCWLACLSVFTERRGTALGISVSLSLHLSVRLFVGLSVSQLIQEGGVLVCTVNLSVHLSTQLSVCLPSCLSFMHFNYYIYGKVVLEYTPVAFFLKLH